MTTKAQEQAIDPRLIGRLLKLQALAKSDANEHEAALAAEKFQELMRANNLSMATIEAASGGTAEGGKRLKGEQKGRAAYKYQQELMRTCGRVNFVVVSVESKWNGRRWAECGYSMIGREANVIGAQNLFDYLSGTIERLAFDYVGQVNQLRLSKEAMAFKEGVADRLRDRLLERHEAALAAQKAEADAANEASRQPSATPGTALVLSLVDVQQDEDDLNADFAYGKEPGTTKRERELRTKISRAMRKAEKVAEDLPGLDTGLLYEAILEALLPAMREQGYPEERLEMAAKTQAKWKAQSIVEGRKDAIKAAKETDKQKAARLERERRASERYWARRDREDAARNERRGSYAYRDGADAGDRVGLDKQVDEKEAAKRLA